MQEFLSFEDFTNNKAFCAVSRSPGCSVQMIICYDKFLLGHCQKKLLTYLINNYINCPNKDCFRIEHVGDEFELYSKCYETNEFDLLEVFKIIIANPSDLFY